MAARANAECGPMVYGEDNLSLGTLWGEMELFLLKLVVEEAGRRGVFL